MRQVWCLTVLSVLVGSGVATAQTPEIMYSWPGTSNATFATTRGWAVDTYRSFPPGTDTWNNATISGATGDLVVTETGNGVQGITGGPLQIHDHYNYVREDAHPEDTFPIEKGCQDVTGLQYIELDIKNNSPSGTVPVDLLLDVIERDDVVLVVGSNGVVAVWDPFTGMVVGGGPKPPAWAVGSGLTTLRVPLNQLTPRQQTSIKSILLDTQAHAAQGNLTWTIKEVRTLGTPLAYRDIVTNNAGTPDDGLDGAFPFTSTDALAIVGNPGSQNQEGLSRNPSGSGSLKWTDKGGTGATGSESGAAIGWGSGTGWRNTTQADQTGSPTSGNSYNERIADFSNYNRMTVRISALDAVNTAGTVGIQGIFAVHNPAGNPDGTPPIPAVPATILTSQNLSTDGLYHDLVYDLSSVAFLKNVWHWGLDVPVHINDIVFNIDTIHLWYALLGDYNNNGKVDGADYVLWRNGGPLQNEGVTLGSNTPEDYAFWRLHFGETSPSGSGSVPSGSGASAALGAVPEPSAAMLLLTAMVGLWWKRRGV